MLQFLPPFDLVLVGRKVPLVLSIQVFQAQALLLLGAQLAIQGMEPILRALEGHFEFFGVGELLKIGYLLCEAADFDFGFFYGV